MRYGSELSGLSATAGPRRSSSLALQDMLETSPDLLLLAPAHTGDKRTHHFEHAALLDADYHGVPSACYAGVMRTLGVKLGTPVPKLAPLPVRRIPV